MTTNRRRHHRHHAVALAVLAVLDAPLLAHALPQGGTVVEGQVTIGTPAAGQLGITQGSARAVVDWRSFGIGANERVSLAQPVGGAALFRVTGSDPSQIFGSLSATGSLFLSNPNGVLFGAGARVDVGSLAATTLGMANADFMAGRLKLAGDSRASVVNEGRIEAAPGGSVVLLGTSVANHGTINAPQGSVALGAGSAATLDVYGNGLLKLNLTAGADGARIDHTGTITADGGTATASAQGAASVLNIGGVVRARSLEQRGGAIYLTGGTGAKVNVTGTLDASGTADGGRIEVRAERIDVAAGAVLRADAGANGHGGTIDAIATDAMRFDGYLSARGGAAGGDGGNAEISGYDTLAMNGSSDLRADAGRFGTLVLDPGSFTILRSNGNVNNTNQISDTSLTTLLGTNSMTLRTATATNNAAETITVDANANVTWSSNATLTLLAGRNIVVNAGAVLSSTSTTTGRDALVMTASGTTATAASFQGISIGAATLRSNGGAIRLTGFGGNSDANNTGIILTDTTVTGNRSGVFLTGTGGAATGAQNGGVWLQGTTSITADNAGALTINGTGGGAGGTTTVNPGIVVPAGASVRLQSSSGAVSLTGRGGVGNASFGIVADGVLTAAAQTQLSLSGTGSGFADGIRLARDGSTLTSTGGGDVTLVADRMTLLGATASTSGTLALATQTAGRAISIGGADTATTLGLSRAELSRFNAGRLEIGSASAGNVSVDLDYTPAAGTGTLALVSGGTVDVQQAITGGATRLNLSGAAGVRLGAALSSNAANVASTRAITIRTPGTFDNVAGAAALSTPNGTWAVSLSTPVGQNFNGLLSGNAAVWRNPVTSAVNPTGNRYAFALAPTVFIDAGTASKVYGDTLPGTVTLNNTPIASVANTFGGVFTDYAGATLGGSYTRSSAGLAATANAGTYTDLTVTNVAGVTTSLLGYSLVAGATGSVVVAQRNVTLTPATQSRNYGDANPATGAATGLVNGDTALLTLSTPATVASAVGSYDLSGANAVFQTGLASNYVIAHGTTANGLTVNPRPITLTPDAQSRLYGDANPARGTASITSGSFVGTDAITDVALTSPATAASFVGTYDLTAGGAVFRSGSDGNYAITYANRANGLTVTQRPVTLTLQGSARRPYGGGVTTVSFGLPTVTSGSLASGDRISSSSASFAGPVLTAPVGTYGGTFIGVNLSNGAGQNTTANYTITRVDAPFFVTPRPVTLTPVAVSRTYGDANPATALATTNGGVGVGLINGDTVSQLNITSPADATSNVGNYASTGSNALFSIGSASNYTISYGTNAAGLVVAPRAVTLTPDAVSRVYGDANPARGTASVTAGNLVNGDTLADVALSSAATTGSFVGSYALSAAGAVFGNGSAANYTITYADRANGLTVTQRPVTLTLQGSVSRPYGGGITTLALDTPTVTSGSLAGTDLVSGYITRSPGPGAGAPVGTYTASLTSVSLSSAAGQDVTPNYAITRVDAPYFVTPRPVTLTPVAVSRTYGDANPATARATTNGGLGVGLINGDTVSQLNITSPANATSNVGNYASTGSNALFSIGSASNYAITYGTNAAGLVIAPRAVTLMPDAVSRVYGDTNPARGTASVTAGNLVNGDTLADVGLSSAATAGTFVGSYPLRASGAVFGTGRDTDYTISYVDNAIGLTITPRPVTLTLGGSASQPYGGGIANIAITAPTVTGGSLAAGDGILGYVTNVAPPGLRAPVGTYGVQFVNVSLRNAAGLDATTSYTITRVDAPFFVTPRPLTLTPVAVSRPYGDANPATAGVTAGAGFGVGLVNGDTVSQVALSTAATPASHAGLYPTTGSNAVFATGAASNYTITYGTNATGLNVTPRLLTVTPVTTTRIYGDANPATAGATGDNLVNGDTLASVSITSPATPASNVGLVPTDASAALFSNGLAGNYTIGYARNPAGLDITPRPITLAASPLSRFYGDATPATGAGVPTVGTIVNGDTVGSVTLSTPALVTSPVGGYDLDASNAVFSVGNASNYAISYVTTPVGVLINPRPLTLTPDPVSRTYGDANPAVGSASVTAGNLVNGDTLGTLTFASPADLRSGVGSYLLDGANPLFTVGATSNYAIAIAPLAGGLTVTPRALTVTPDALARIYGDANPASATASADNLVNGDTVASVSVTTPATLASNVGLYPTDASAVLFSNGAAGNYTISYARNPAGLDIAPRPLTLTPNPTARPYGDANPVSFTAFGNAGGLVNGDSVASVTLSTSATPASNVGSYDTTGSNALFAAGLATNYTIAYATNPAGLDVTPRALTLTPVATTRLYGDTNPVLGSATGNAGGLVNGDSVASVSLASPAAVTSNVGTYDTTAGNALFATGLASNYTIAYATNPLGLDVTARPLVVTPDAVQRLYGDANPANATARGDNLVNGDTLASVSLASSATAASRVGSYSTSADNALFASGLAGNYTITYADNANGLAVTPRPLTLTPDAASRTYGDANPARGTASGNAGGLVNGDTVASVALASPAVVNSGIGRYDLAASDALFGQGSASNYLLSYAPLANGLLVTPRSVDVAARPGQAKVAGRPDPVFGFDITGGSLVAGDAFSGSLTRAAGEALGSYPILQGTLALGPNYTLGYAGAPFTVTSTSALPLVDRTPAPGTPAASPADLLATLPPTAAGPAGTEALTAECVREAALGGAAGARLVNRGIRLPAGVADACRPPGAPAGS